MRTFGRKNTWIQLVAGIVLPPGPRPHFLGEALPVGVDERLGGLSEHDDECFHGVSGLPASMPVGCRKDAAANWKNSAF
jgi:hypothetical protein